jgi:hypothetical protein
MKKAKKIARPPGEVTAIRLTPELRAAIDDWRRKQKRIPSRSEAIRLFIEQALGKK